MKVLDFDFELAAELIATHPLPDRDASRMLVVNYADTLNHSRRPLTDVENTFYSNSPLAGESERSEGGGYKNDRNYTPHRHAISALATPPQGGSWSSSQSLQLSAKRGLSRYEFSEPKHQSISARIRNFAQKMRREMTSSEKKFWYAVNKERLGFKFRRQFPIDDKYIADFVCYEKKLIIEIDGSQHYENKNNDEIRTEYLQKFGFNVVRFWNWNIDKNLEGCLTIVNDILTNSSFEKRMEEFKKNLPFMRLDDKGNVVVINPPPGAQNQRRHPSEGGELEPSLLADKHITDFVSYLRPGDVVVFNNSKVIPARFDATTRNGTKYEITLHTSADTMCHPKTQGVASHPAESRHSVNEGGRGGSARGAGEGDTQSAGNQWFGFAKKFQKLSVGEILTLGDGTKIKILDKNDESGLLIEFHCDNVFATLDHIGKMPLPPYMKRTEEAADRKRYQTIYAQPLGSMAAPTAGLHFTPKLLDAIRDAGAQIVNITLHVGSGTWQPVKSEDTADHKMHSEWGEITPEQAKIINKAKRVIAVGTTSLRLLESAAQSSPPTEGCGRSPRGGSCNIQTNSVSQDERTLPEPPRRLRRHPSTGGEHHPVVVPNKSGGELAPSRFERVAPFCSTTDIFITPGYKFKVVDILLTNFHLPKSTLFMLVSAFAGLPEMQAAYVHAAREKYRFFSYGDCCLLFRKD